MLDFNQIRWTHTRLWPKRWWLVINQHVMWLPKTKSEHAVFWSDLMLEFHTVSLQPCKHTAWICEGNVVKMFRKTKTFLGFFFLCGYRWEDGSMWAQAVSAGASSTMRLDLLVRLDRREADVSRSNNRQPRLATQDCQPDLGLWLNDVHRDQFNWENLSNFGGAYDLFWKILWQDLDLDSQ